MVLSLGFILAFIGAAVALLIGILIFSEVSDSIICPAPGSAPTPGVPAVITGFDNTGSLGASGDAFYTEAGIDSDFVTTTGILGQGVIKNGTSSLDTDGEIIIGLDPDTWRFLHAGNVGSNLTSINFWINGDVIGSPVYPLINTGGSDNLASGNDPGFGLYTQSGTTMRFSVNDNTSATPVSSNIAIGSVPPDDASWHMVSFMMDQGNRTGDYVILCIDGVCDTGIDAQTNPFFDLTAGGITPVFNMTIGGGAPFGFSVTQNTFDFDELTIWNGWILSQSEINTMYNSGTGSSASGIASGTIVVHLSFDVGTEVGTGGGAGSPGSSGQGNTECENAKDTAWTVIGILPVALFFALFAIFGALGRQN